jgi:hypothetical protein
LPDPLGLLPPQIIKVRASIETKKRFTFLCAPNRLVVVNGPTLDEKTLCTELVTLPCRSGLDLYLPSVRCAVAKAAYL